MIKETLKTLVYTIEPPDFSPKTSIVAIYVTHRDHLLLLELAPHKREGGAWTVPAGKLEAHEPPLLGAKRELFEETGIDISPHLKLDALGQLYMRKPNEDYAYHLFELRFENEPDIHLSEEHTNYIWAQPHEWNTLQLMSGGEKALEEFLKKRSPVKKTTGI